jgi:molecular chaperone GrpE
MAEEETVQNTADPEVETPTLETDPELEALQARIAELETQSKANLDGWQRERAEFQNYKRRTDANMATLHTSAAAKALEGFLPVIDDLELAVNSLPVGDETANFTNGVRLVLRKALTQLEKEGVTRIATEPGMEYDPNLHEALLSSPSDQYESGQILNVLRHGYQANGRVLRAAQVQVVA